MTYEHTPEPWEPWQDSPQPDGLGWVQGIVCRSGGLGHGCQPAKVAGGTAAECLANARLVSQAPSMFRALDSLLDLIRSTRSGEALRDFQEVAEASRILDWARHGRTE